MASKRESALTAPSPPKTQAKIRTLKESLNTEFAEIFKFCIFVLGASSRPQLISATLRTLKAFLSWIPLGYLFETDLIRTLIERFFAAAQFRNAALEAHGNRVISRPRAEVRSQDNPAVRGVLQALGQVVPPPNASLASALRPRVEKRTRRCPRLALFFLASSRPIYAWSRRGSRVRCCWMV